MKPSMIRMWADVLRVDAQGFQLLFQHQRSAGEPG